MDRIKEIGKFTTTVGDLKLFSQRLIEQLDKNKQIHNKPVGRDVEGLNDHAD